MRCCNIRLTFCFLSLIISAIVASFAAISIYGNGAAAGSSPDLEPDGIRHRSGRCSHIIQPSGRRDEIGLAEDALAVMQGALVRELNQKKHLAALGLAVARSTTTCATCWLRRSFLSDRPVELVRPVGAASRSETRGGRSTARSPSVNRPLAYWARRGAAPKLATIALRQLVTDAAETVSALRGRTH